MLVPQEVFRLSVVAERARRGLLFVRYLFGGDVDSRQRLRRPPLCFGLLGALRGGLESGEQARFALGRPCDPGSSGLSLGCQPVFYE